MLGLLSLGILAGSTASAQVPSVRWSAPADCPQGEAVAQEIARLLARSEASPLDVEGEVAPDPEAGFRLRLTIRSGEAEDTRSLESAECATLGSAAALLAALAVDPTVVDRAEAPPVDERAVELVGDLGDPRDRPSAPPSEPLRVEIVARGLLDFGTMPDVAGGVGLAASLGGAFRGELAFGFFPERFAPIAGSNVIGGELTLLTASLGLAWRAYDEAVAIGPRAGIELGLFFGRGTGVTDPASAVVPAVLLELGAEISLRALRPFVASIGGDVLVGLFRPRFQLDGVGEVHQVAPVAGRFSLSAGIEIP